MNWRALLSPAKPDTVRMLAIMRAGPDRDSLLRISEQEHWHVDVAGDVRAGVELLRCRPFAVAVCDRDTVGPDWRNALDILVAHAAGACVILISHAKDDYLWQEVLQRGGYDVITKPFRQELVVRSIQFAGRKPDR